MVDGLSRIRGADSRRAGWGGYTLRVVREVRWVFNRRLKVSNVFDSLIAAGNSFQIVGAEKLKERLLKLVVQKGIDKSLMTLKYRQGRQCTYLLKALVWFLINSFSNCCRILYSYHVNLIVWWWWWWYIHNYDKTCKKSYNSFTNLADLTCNADNHPRCHINWQKALRLGPRLTIDLICYSAFVQRPGTRRRRQQLYDERHKRTTRARDVETEHDHYKTRFNSYSSCARVQGLLLNDTRWKTLYR